MARVQSFSDYTAAKIVLVGNPGCGKTSLILRHCDNAFSESYTPTLGVDFKMKLAEIDQRYFKMQIWELSGHARYRHVLHSYCKGAGAILMVYDVTDRASFDAIPGWAEELCRNACADAPRCIVAAKDDVEQPVVSLDEGLALAQSLQVSFFACSAKTGSNVDQLFNEVARTVSRSRALPGPRVVTVFASAPGPDGDVDLACFGLSGEEVGACQVPGGMACDELLPRLQEVCELGGGQLTAFLSQHGQEIPRRRSPTEYVPGMAEVSVVLASDDDDLATKLDAAVLAEGLHPDDVGESFVLLDSAGMVLDGALGGPDVVFPVTLKAQVKRRKKPATIAEFFGLHR